MADAPKVASKGVVVHPRVLVVGGTLALTGLAIASVFLWMVPNAAAREEKAACRGMRGDLPLANAICDGRPCTLPAPAPDFTAYDHEGKEVHLSDFKGKVVLLNFWASWCGVCKSEKPSLSWMAGDTTRDDFVVLALSSDRDWDDMLMALIQSLARNWRASDALTEATNALPPSDRDTKASPAAVKSTLLAYREALPNGVPFKVFMDPPNDDGNIGAIAKRWGIKAVPETALIDRKGNIRAYFVNKRDWSSGVAQTCLRSVLDED